MNTEERNIFKQTLEDVKSPGFEEQYWKTLEKRLDKNKQRKRLWLLFAATIIIGSTLVIKTYNGSHTDLGTQTRYSTPQNIVVSVSPATVYAAPEIPKNTMAQQDLNPHLKTPVITAEKEMVQPEPVAVIQTTIIKEDAVITLTGLPRLSFRILSIPNTTPLEMLPVIPAFIPLLSSQTKVTGKPKQTWALDFSTGIHNASKHLNPGSAAMPYYTARREQEEHDAIYTSPRLNLNYCYNNKWTASLGLEYASYGERTAYNPYALKQDITSRYSYVPDSFPSLNVMTRRVTWQHDTSVYISQDTALAEKHDQSVAAQNGRTRIQYFEIPVTFGYLWHYKSMSFALKTGASFGWLHAQSVKGAYLNTTGTGLTSLADEHGNISRFMVNYLLQLRVGQQITSRIMVFAEPSFKANMGTMYHNESAQQRYRLAGAYFGVCINLK